MPKLKGSKLGAKTKVFSNIAKTKKPGKAELAQRGPHSKSDWRLMKDKAT